MRPLATLPAPARDPPTLQGQRRGGGHPTGGSGGLAWPRPSVGVLPGPAHSGSELRWACEGASSPFVPYPSAPLPDTLAASRRCRSLRSPYPVWRSGAGGRDASFPFRPHGERWEAREELRPCACEGKWGVSWGDDRLTACPWQREDGEASGAGSLKRCAALGDPWP